jgi:hypothetical protein
MYMYMYHIFLGHSARWISARNQIPCNGPLSQISFDGFLRIVRFLAWIPAGSQNSHPPVESQIGLVVAPPPCRESKWENFSLYRAKLWAMVPRRESNSVQLPHWDKQAVNPFSNCSKTGSSCPSVKSRKRNSPPARINTPAWSNHILHLCQLTINRQIIRKRPRVKGTVQRKLRWVKSVINQQVLL